MEFLSEIFIKFWKEAIVAVLLTVILPFIRRYVRRQRSKMINVFKENKYLAEALRDEQKKRKEAEEEVERLRLALKQEQVLQEETEQDYQAESQFTCSDDKWKNMIEDLQRAREEGNMKGTIGSSSNDFRYSESMYEMLPKVSMSKETQEAFLKEFTESRQQQYETEKDVQ